MLPDILRKHAGGARTVGRDEAALAAQNIQNIQQNKSRHTRQVDIRREPARYLPEVAAGALHQQQRHRTDAHGGRGGRGDRGHPRADKDNILPPRIRRARHTKGKAPKDRDSRNTRYATQNHDAILPTQIRDSSNKKKQDTETGVTLVDFDPFGGAAKKQRSQERHQKQRTEPQQRQQRQQQGSAHEAVDFQPEQPTGQGGVIPLIPDRVVKAQAEAKKNKVVRARRADDHARMVAGHAKQQEAAQQAQRELDAFNQQKAKEQQAKQQPQSGSGGQGCLPVLHGLFGDPVEIWRNIQAADHRDRIRERRSRPPQQQRAAGVQTGATDRDAKLAQKQKCRVERLARERAEVRGRLGKNEQTERDFREALGNNAKRPQPPAAAHTSDQTRTMANRMNSQLLDEMIGGAPVTAVLRKSPGGGPNWDPYLVERNPYHH